MPGPIVDFNLWHDQDANTQRGWLEFIERLIIADPDKAVFVPSENLKQEIRKTYSAKVKDPTSDAEKGCFIPNSEEAKSKKSIRPPVYLVFFETIGQGVFGLVYRVRYVLKFKEGRLEVSDRKFKKYQYAPKQICTPKDARDENWDFKKQMVLYDQENKYVSRYLRENGDRPYRPTLFYEKAEVALIIMRLVEGPTLDKFVLKAGWDRSFATIFNILWQLTEILFLFHMDDVVHFDLKVDNLIYDDKRNLFCVDYGCMIPKGKIAPEYRGTYGYFAPEHLQTVYRAMPQSDIYSALAIFLFMLGATRCFIKKRDNDANIVELNREVGPQAILNSYKLMAYDQRGLLADRFSLTPKINTLFKEIIENMGKFDYTVRANAVWLKSKMEVMYALAINTHLAELRRFSLRYPNIPLAAIITQLENLQDDKACTRQATIRYSELIDEAFAEIDKYIATQEQALPPQKSFFSGFIQTKEQKHLSELKKDMSQLGWPKKEPPNASRERLSEEWQLTDETSEKTTSVSF